jgi:hypothetical protein
MSYVFLFLNKILWFALFMAILNVLKHAYLFFHALLTHTEDNRVKYTPPYDQVVVLAASIAYIFTIIFTGFF